MVENIRNATVTVQTSLTVISPPLMAGQMNVRVFTNTSTSGQIISLSWGEEANAGQGIVLYPAGSWSESVDAKFFPSNEKVTAIASAAGGTLAVHERIA
jgi:hypothetical protein